jgi:transcriptional accessory protein Tex/SPT6
LRDALRSVAYCWVYGGDNPLDATWIHPESYDAARRLLDRIGSSEADLALEVTPARQIPAIESPTHESTASRLRFWRWRRPCRR